MNVTCMREGTKRGRFSFSIFEEFLDLFSNYWRDFNKFLYCNARSSTIMQLNVQRCCQCGQVLPESYEPPADEDWTTGIFGCAEDTESCKSLLALLL